MDSLESLFLNVTSSYSALLNLSSSTSSSYYTEGYMEILNAAYDFIKKNEEYKNVPFTKLTEELEYKIGGDGGRSQEEGRKMEREERRREEGFCLKGFKIKDSQKRKKEENESEEGMRVLRKYNSIGINL